MTEDIQKLKKGNKGVGEGACTSQLFWYNDNNVSLMENYLNGFGL